MAKANFSKNISANVGGIIYLVVGLAALGVVAYTILRRDEISSKLDGKFGIGGSGNTTQIPNNELNPTTAQTPNDTDSYGSRSRSPTFQELPASENPRSNRYERGAGYVRRIIAPNPPPNSQKQDYVKAQGRVTQFYENNYGLSANGIPSFISSIYNTPIPRRRPSKPSTTPYLGNVPPALQAYTNQRNARLTSQNSQPQNVVKGRSTRPLSVSSQQQLNAAKNNKAQSGTKASEAARAEATSRRRYGSIR